ncbi:helix-turn-helix domain-containing protein [Mumia zhuanghuii]|uniref:Helix-turn-helix domain-containing protein n=2 Tax=Mumia TaxID=1546255 RepID=A0ABW1QLK8_9ACTN|nr:MULTISPECIES: helix-turn-helix domain-containing protein [Mumia]KAA1423952.1 helix-turn-helix domain-containing protein [Mumia zhuanghuii]
MPHTTRINDGPHHSPSRIRINHAAELYGCTPKTIRRMISRGEITGYKFGPRIILVSPEEIESVLRVIPTVSCDDA